MPYNFPNINNFYYLINKTWTYNQIDIFNNIVYGKDF